MAVCTPPHTPPSYTMNNTLPHLPIHLLSTWSEWRPAESQFPPSPPQSTMTQKLRRIQPEEPCSQLHPTLPPITHFDRRLSRQHSPSGSRFISVNASRADPSVVTPPQNDDSAQWHTYGQAELKLPPIQAIPEPVDLYSPTHSTDYNDDAQMLSPPPPAPALDWLETSTQRSFNFIAEKVCEMVCYLWFSSLSQTSSSSPQASKRCRQSEDSTFFPKPNSSTATLQFAVSPAFTRFMQKLLETTQVSQSVIVLSLRYIYRLKECNRFTHGHAGSEYRVAVAALMLANKFVDDNTYTNKTWSEVSGISLEELNKMEREFLMGIDFSLYVDEPTYYSWVNLLKGLVLAKEKDSRQWHRSRTRGRCARPRLATSHLGSRGRPYQQRARSISPSRSTASYAYSVPPPVHPAPISRQESEYSTPPRSGSKRSASDAFSPTSATFPPIKPAKRPMGLSLQIPELTHTGPSTASSMSPSEPLQSFSKMSLGASPAVVRPNGTQRGYNSPAPSALPPYASVVGQDQVPQTLVTAYRADDRNPYAVPQQLYFYSLAGSPLDEDEESKFRKARLRYHPAPPPSMYVPPPPQPAMPMVVQSATASPHDIHSNVPPITLPHFSEGFWNCPHPTAPPIPSQSQTYRYPVQPPQSEGSVTAAPFANAGPPGIQFYANNVHLTPEQYWPRARQL
ncbi:hypothetical protein QCA50_008388 [Cerrena zonata]|uniref:Cyclin-like domain-containing protein n=1 Tax=Cerrena zonata TaxID=2478898 RepID=A0AAW0G3V4_9APHY